MNKGPGYTHLVWAEPKMNIREPRTQDCETNYSDDLSQKYTYTVTGGWEYKSHFRDAFSESNMTPFP